MIIYPAIDLYNGQCVRLYQGDFSRITVYSSEPANVLKGFLAEGAQWIHIVDLNAAQDNLNGQYDLICSLVQNGTVKVQVGGGLRTENQLDLLLNLGVSRVVLGSIAVQDIDLVKKWFLKFGPEKIVLALDVRIQNGIPIVATSGWQENSKKSLMDLLSVYQEIGLKHVLCTDISKDGTLLGPNVELYKGIAEQFSNLELQASGGIASLEDIKNVSPWVSGVIVGRVLYDKKISLKEALSC